MTGPALDPRVARGMGAQLEQRRARIAAGERPIGWKVGFGSPAGMERLGIDRPLVGFLTDRGLVADGGRVAIGGWTGPALEPEVAVHLATDVGPGAGRAEVERAIGGLSAAIELADVDVPPSDPVEVLAGNIFHRHVLLGPVDADRSSGHGLSARLVVDGEQVAATDDPEALTGALVEVVWSTAELLEACGERLRAGEVVITGSAVAPLAVRPGQHVRAELGPLGALEVTLTR